MRNKKGFSYDFLINFLIIVAIALAVSTLVACLYDIFTDSANNEQVDPLSEQKYCEKYINRLSCEEIKICYDNCRHQGFISWIQECRSSFLPDIIRCYGSNGGND